MYRKLIIFALAGAFMLGLAAQGLATITSGGPAYKTADGFVTSNWPGVQGTSTSDLLASMTRGATITTTKTAGSGSNSTTDTDTADKAKMSEKSENTKPYVFRRFDTRDPRNHVIRPGGVVVKP